MLINTILPELHLVGLLYIKANFLFSEVGEDYFIRRMPFRDQASIHINDVLIAVAVDSGEQNIYKKVRVRAWHRLSFLFLESAIKGNIYLYLLELFAFLQIADIKSETEDAVVF